MGNHLRGSRRRILLKLPEPPPLRLLLLLLRAVLLRRPALLRPALLLLLLRLPRLLWRGVLTGLAVRLAVRRRLLSWRRIPAVCRVPVGSAVRRLLSRGAVGRCAIPCRGRHAARACRRGLALLRWGTARRRLLLRRRSAVAARTGRRSVGSSPWRPIMAWRRTVGCRCPI
jgi:hypothetical protein